MCSDCATGWHSLAQPIKDLCLAIQELRQLMKTRKLCRSRYALKRNQHTHPQTIADDLDISYSSVQRMVKRSKLNQFKRLTTPRMNGATCARCVDHAASLVEKFGSNPTMIERTVFQDESNFSLQMPNKRTKQACLFQMEKG